MELRAKPATMGPYRMALPQLKELRRQFNEFPDTRFIIPSKAPYDVSILFQNKYDGSLRMCMDCWALNKVEEQVPLFRSLSTCLINLVR